MMHIEHVFMLILAAQASSKEIKVLYTDGYSYTQYFPLEENLAPDKTLRFSVRTSRDAHILLAPSFQEDGPVYEIVLGAHNNTMSYIRGRYPGERTPSATIRTVNLLNKQEHRNFWIRLEASGQRTAIQIGVGGTDTPFQEWLDPQPLLLQYLSFRSGIQAEWRYGYRDAANTVGIARDNRKIVVSTTYSLTGFGQYLPLSEIVSHSDNGVALYFTVRTGEELQVLLTPGVTCLGDVYEFGITTTGAYLRRKHLGHAKAYYHRDGLLNDREQLGFWIKLTRDGEVILGTGGSAVSILSWLDPDPLSPQFVSFSLYRAKTAGKLYVSNFADLQYGLGPEYSLASQDCRPRWKDSVGQRLPPGAVRGGYNNQVDLFVCRASHEGRLTPGSFAPAKDSKGQCQVDAGWYVHGKSEFQALTGCRFSWMPATFGNVPKGAIAGGNADQNTTLYVARVSQMRQVIVGKLQPNHLITYAVFSNVIVRPYTHYEVLVNHASRQ